MNNKGFTLIEVLFGLIILAVGLLALAALQITSTRGSSFSNNVMQATYLAQDSLESLKNLQCNSQGTDPKLNAGTYNDGAITVAVSGSYSSVAFNRSYQIVDNVAGYKEIRCSVTWNDGVNHSITFSTIRSQ